MKTCSVCGLKFIPSTGGKGPRSHPDLCSAHFHRFRRGSKAWKDPSIRGAGVKQERIRISAEAKKNLDRLFAKAKKRSPAISFPEFFDDLVIYDANTETLA